MIPMKNCIVVDKLKLKFAVFLGLHLIGLHVNEMNAGHRMNQCVDDRTNDSHDNEPLVVIDVVASLICLNISINFTKVKMGKKINK